ncbi:hypothetical protein FA95DRAFT_1557781 [Auriscalpium vulgare]|uniref:Uncharacterized protein n=1 Tax=Auriscalpium vulgare TaxID=40419 RepID=A0ACB8RYT4_9AGAM|nr:hypothetical protein FA95DRAFT_1557781 [Auriscalpium vulgare]
MRGHSSLKQARELWLRCGCSLCCCGCWVCCCGRSCNAQSRCHEDWNSGLPDGRQDIERQDYGVHERWYSAGNSAEDVRRTHDKLKPVKAESNTEPEARNQASNQDLWSMPLKDLDEETSEMQQAALTLLAMKYRWSAPSKDVEGNYKAGWLAALMLRWQH